MEIKYLQKVFDLLKALSLSLSLSLSNVTMKNSCTNAIKLLPNLNLLEENELFSGIVANMFNLQLCLSIKLPKQFSPEKFQPFSKNARTFW